MPLSPPIGSPPPRFSVARVRQKGLWLVDSCKLATWYVLISEITRSSRLLSLSQAAWKHEAFVGPVAVLNGPHSYCTTRTVGAKSIGHSRWLKSRLPYRSYAVFLYVVIVREELLWDEMYSYAV